MFVHPPQSGVSNRLRLSISTRLTLWYGVTLILLMSAFALFSFASFQISMHQDFDRHLIHEQSQLIPYVRINEGKPEFASLEELQSVAYRTDGEHGTYVRLLSPDGNILYNSPNFAHHAPLPVALPEEMDEFTISRDWESRAARTLYSPLVASDGALQGWLEVTGFEWSLNREIHWMGRALIFGVFFSILLAVGGGYLVAKRALSPVASLNEAAHTIRASDLSARLPTQFGVRDELSDLAETFNSMMDRLEASFNRERRFTANAAHEMLTPLATMRNEIETTLRRQRDSAQYQDTLRRMLVDVEEMSLMVKDLLQLSSVERLNEFERVPVNLSEVTCEYAERLRRRAEAKGIEIEMKVSEQVYILAGYPRIGEIIDNLLDNALKYTPEGGRVSVVVEKQEDQVILSVRDTGIGFEPETADQLFDRFYRADTPEVQAQPGSGLGLSIVQAIVEIYGGRITAWSEGIRRGSTFTVSFPSVSEVPA